MKCLAIIPARGGSKRIPGKNIRPFLGRPIIAYSIEAAVVSDLFAEVMVSTDNGAVAAVARECGATVPFLRSAASADDFAPLATVMDEVLRAYETAGEKFDAFCCLLPTAPLIGTQELQQAYAMLAENDDADAVVPVVAFSYPIQRALRIDADGRVAMRNPEHTFTRSQDLEPSYHDTGTFYWMRTAAFNRHHTLFPPATLGLPLAENRVQDIDVESDWQLAEFKYKFLHAGL
ncbi:MAG: pseudaminic acid cytidylyltransferase [Rikenellaceae bacterium]|jgi:N-acylneuraminate cytidylyltransferase|nr:pseudaminic acid cytidylyltransferase [Rikenellaceae bacterium]